jgi:hypothetical protein
MRITLRAEKAIVENGGSVTDTSVRIPGNAKLIEGTDKGAWGNFSCKVWEFADGSQVVYSSDEGYTLGRAAQQ